MALAFYCMSPRVIAVPCLLLRLCQSTGAKWQPSGNRIMGRRGSQESPSSDLLAKWSDCVVMSWALRWPFPWQFLQTYQEVLASVWCKVTSINARYFGNNGLFSNLQKCHTRNMQYLPPLAIFLWKCSLMAVALVTAYSCKTNDKSNILSVLRKNMQKLLRFSLPSYCDDLSHL